MIRNAHIPVPRRTPQLQASCSSRNRLALLLLLFCVLIPSRTLAAADERYLVTDVGQVIGLTDATSDTFDPESGGQSEATLPKGASFTVKLSDPITITDTQGLVVTFGRWNNEGSPKATKVEGRLDGGDWETIGYAYMQFRGGEGTIEYSKPIYADNKQYDDLQFTVLKTALGYAQVNGSDCVRFNKFNIFLLKDGDLYPDGRIDPWRLNTDYYKDYIDYTFQPTNGILSTRNHYGNNRNYPTETPWGEKNTYTYQGGTYELPTFHMQDDNQMPHVTEHTVYVMPGEIIPLLPYYDMPRNGRYYAHFYHWYNYNKDIDGVPQKQDYGHVLDPVTNERLLDFLVDPAGVTYTDNAGYFGGNGLPRKGSRFVIHSIQDFIDFRDKVNDGETGLSAILAADIDFNGEEAKDLEITYITIGSATNPYSGSFNGNGHTISNMNIVGAGNETMGLFGHVAVGASIKNLRLENCNATNGGNTGILIGEIAAGAGSVSISNVMISGDIDHNVVNGGIGAMVGNLGANAVIELTNSCYKGNINSGSVAAALVGEVNVYSNSSVNVENCYVDAFVNNYYMDSYSGYYAAAVKANKDKHSFNNCVINIRTASATINGASSFAKQSGAECCGYEYIIDTESKTDYSKPNRIYVEKDNWTDFVLCIDQWGNSHNIVGCTGWIDIKGKTYGYFEHNYGDYIKYAIMPYIGDQKLDEGSFSWDLSGLQPLCDIDGYEHKDYEYLHITSKDFYETIEENTVLSQWKTESGEYVPPMNHVEDSALKTTTPEPDRYLSNPDVTKSVTRAQSWYGTSATFFKPLDTSKAPDDIENLRLGTHSYDIAVDISHEFDATANHNLDDDEQTIYSPIINYRHIFHVVSGKDFADSVTVSTDANKKYLLGKKRIVYAPKRDGKVFYVRLPTEFPVPFKKRLDQWLDIKDNIYSSTNFYYKSDATHYDRASGFDIEIYKDGEKISDSRFDNAGNRMFDFEENPRNAEDYNFSQGIRKYYENGPTYYTAGGEGVVYRMLECKNPQVGTYTVRIYATDDTGKDLHIWNDESSRIYMMEYEITFLDENEASVKLEESIPDYHKDSYLSEEDICGDPVVFLNFDEYRAFEDETQYNQDDYFQFHDDNRQFKSFKWPTIWSQCSYSFGYGDYWDYDYNEYLITNHGSQVRYTTNSLYDRLYYDTNSQESGYYYWVNAASDPGVTSRLRIDKLCLGSTVIVTGWIADFSGKTYADVAFNFTAVMKDGTRQRIHTFISEPVDTSAEWYHVYYSFVPELPETLRVTDVDHYEIEVENNCQSSDGADYAVDDIRAYIVTPEITATQLSPICDGEDASTGVRLRTRFDKLLDAQGIPEAEGDDPGADLSLYIALFDKTEYDRLYSDEKVTDLQDVIAGSKIQMLATDGKTVVDFLKIPMKSNFSKMTEFNLNKPDEPLNTALGYQSAKGVEYLLANITPFDDKLKAGRQYYVSVRVVDESVANQKTLTLEDLAVSEDDCARYGIMTLRGSGIVKVDGFAYSDGEPINVCVGQAPVLQVELLKVPENGQQTVSKEKYYYDWFRGPLENFPDEAYILLGKFRIDYSDAIEIPVADHRVPGFDNLTDEKYKEEADKYQELAKLVARDVLVLHQSSFVFPTIKRGDLYSGDQLIVTAIPIIGEQKEEGEKICGGPNEIHLNVEGSSPLMYDGFETIEYPSYMSDVPLRVGLRQLRAVSTKITADIEEGMRVLEVPLRAISSYKEENTTAVMVPMKKEVIEGETVGEDPYVYIIETDDPRYKSLIAHPGNDLEDSSLNGFVKLDDKTGVIEGLLPVGLVTDMTAVKGGDRNAVNIVFTKDMRFREGYYYKMRFDFNENLDIKPGDICDGQVVFTVKVVPEYQMWTGDAGRNWNNDENWRRVAKNELFLGDADTEIGTEKAAAADHTSGGGNNDNRLSYAPMDFTKVIIPNDVKNFPLMFERTLTDVNTLQGSRKWDNKDADASASHHGATKDIKYDMASLALDNVLACRPWYANTCEEIHFQYGAELQRQQWFAYGDNYKKAWVDLVTEPNRWYTLATPLKQVVAGDMYTISVGAKQNTELFRDINFDNKYYGRFKPAVYQRSWNRDGEAELYEFGDNTNSHIDVAKGITLNWSRLYNQVDVDYSGGNGFAINTQYYPENDEDAENSNNTVRFRLPKADNMYRYFTTDDQTEEIDNKTLSDRADRHSLNDVPMSAKLKAKAESKYFLTGNPFIARMDMAEFFNGNSNLAGKYWILSGDSQTAYLWLSHDSKFISTSVAGAADGESVAPMQGFFVESKNETKELDLDFTAAMIKVTDGEGSAGPLKVASSADVGSTLCITASVDGEAASRALIRLDAAADTEYDEEEDVALLIDPSQKMPTAVYTVASERALAINSLDRIVRTEVGVSADPETRTLLRFDGVDEADCLRLLDTATGEAIDLYDGMTYDVVGSSVGRLYLVASAETMAVDELTIRLDARTVTVSSPKAGIEARAFDAAGLSLGEWHSDTPVLSFELPEGLIMVEVTAGGKKITRKFIVK